MSGFEYLWQFCLWFFHKLMTPPWYGICIWFLSLIFLWSGSVKLRHPALAAMAMVDFGIVQNVKPILGIFLGVLEVTLAILIVIYAFPPYVLLAASLLLCLFVFLIAQSLWRKAEFPCFCFGDINTNLSKWTLVRTGSLALLACVMALAPIPTRPSRVVYIGILEGVTAAAVLGMIVLLTRVPDLLTWNQDPLGLRARRTVE